MTVDQQALSKILGSEMSQISGAAAATQCVIERHKPASQRRVIKCDLSVSPGSELLWISPDATILCVKVQRGIPVIYIEEASPLKAAMSSIEIHCVVTGASPPVGGRYIGTCMLNKDTYVTHYYVITKEDTK